MLNIKNSLQKSINSINIEVDKLITIIKNELIERDSQLKAEGIGSIYYNMEWHDTAYLWIYDKDNKFSIDTWELKNEDLTKYIDGLVEYCDKIRNYLWLVRSHEDDWKIVLWEDN